MYVCILCTYQTSIILRFSDNTGYKVYDSPCRSGAWDAGGGGGGHQYLGLQPPGQRGGRQPGFFLPHASALTTCTRRGRVSGGGGGGRTGS